MQEQQRAGEAVGEDVISDAENIAREPDVTIIASVVVVQHASAGAARLSIDAELAAQKHTEYVKEDIWEHTEDIMPACAAEVVKFTNFFQWGVSPIGV